MSSAVSTSSGRLGVARLIAIVETAGRDTAKVLERTQWLCAHARSGTVVVQLRDKEQPARSRMDLGATLRRITATEGQLLAVNDRVDIALLLDADAVHLGERSLSPLQARSFGLGGSVAISVARHDPAHVDVEGADGVLLSPIVSERKGRRPLGVSELGVARSRLRKDCRLYALGGVGSTTARACLDAGADGVAVAGALWDGDCGAALIAALGIGR